MKKLFILIITLLFFIPYYVNAEVLVPSVDSSEKIYDYADLLTSEEEEKLRNDILDVIEKYNIDIVFVTLETNPYGFDEEDTKEYASDFYDYNRFGVGEERSGVIVVVDMGNRYQFFETSGSSILVFDDSIISLMRDSAAYYLTDEKYYEAFNSYLDDIKDYTSNGNSLSNVNFCIDENGEYYKCREDEEKPKEVNWFVSLLTGAVGSFISIFAHTKKYKGVHLATNANSYLKDSTIDNKVDQFMTTFTSRVRITDTSNNNGGGPSLGGGSSVFKGSSGRTHGGGGGHF
ncbi:MAG: TPM domain-containing protein [Bacilli bacterium]|nr:TPM domain-containing protein [Bacilli bacterium]